MTATAELDTPRRRATDLPKSLGQIAYEFMAVRVYESFGMEAKESSLGSMRWENQTPNWQKDWEDCAQKVVEAFKQRVVAL